MAVASSRAEPAPAPRTRPPGPPVAVILLAIGVATAASLGQRSPESVSGLRTVGMEAAISAPGLTRADAVPAQVRPAPETRHEHAGPQTSVSRIAGTGHAPASPSPAGPSATAQETGSRPEAGPEIRLRNLLVGGWRQEFFGARVLTVRPDGTGEMIIRPNDLWKAAFGAELRLTMFWSLAGDRIDYGIRSGTPADRVRQAVQLWGDHWNEQIVELTSERLVLLAADGVTRSVWERVPAEPVRSAMAGSR